MKIKVKYAKNRKIKTYKIKNFYFIRHYNNFNKKELLIKKIELKNNNISIFKYNNNMENLFTNKFSEYINLAIDNNNLPESYIYKYYYYFELIKKICIGIMKNRLIGIKNIFFDISNYHQDKNLLLLIVEFHTVNRSSYREFIYLKDIWSF